MTFRVVLKSLKDDSQIIVLADEIANEQFAEQTRRNWRRVLGGKHWTVDRRPGLDTLDHLALKVELVAKIVGEH